MADRDDIVREARALLETPFRHQGRVAGVGLDCAGVPIVIARTLGLVASDFDVNAYARTPDGESLQGFCEQYMRRIPPQQMRPGDVVLVRWQDGAPQHLGVLVPYRHDGALSMVHAESRRYNKVCETRVVFGRSMRLVAVYAFPGVS